MRTGQWDNGRRNARAGDATGGDGQGASTSSERDQQTNKHVRSTTTRGLAANRGLPAKFDSRHVPLQRVRCVPQILTSTALSAGLYSLTRDSYSRNNRYAHKLLYTLQCQMRVTTRRTPYARSARYGLGHSLPSAIQQDLRRDHGSWELNHTRYVFCASSSPGARRQRREHVV